MTNTNSISKDVITHKLKIKGLETKYISKDMAQAIFDQIIDKETNKVIIVNPSDQTYISKYKDDIELTPLDREDRTIEDILFMAGLTKLQKEEVRQIIADRKKERKSVTDGVIANIITKVKGC